MAIIKKAVRKVCLRSDEGKAEEVLCDYLKQIYHTKNQVRVYCLGGFDSLSAFEKRYDRLQGRINGNPQYEQYQLLKPDDFIFLFDDDLQDSSEISKWITKKGHKVIQLSPNLEGFLLGMVDVTLGFNDRSETFRSKCKHKFLQYFGKEAHKMKRLDWDKIFGKGGEKVLTLRTKYPSLNELIKLLE